MEQLSQTVLRHVLDDFMDRNLTANDLSNGYVGVNLAELKRSCCDETSTSSVDFDLALKDLEEGALIHTGPMDFFDNPPNSSVNVIGLFSRYEYAYLTEQGYKAARKVPRESRMASTIPVRFPSNPGTLSTTYDLFLSHASEDKDSIARPLYTALTEAGVSVWFDEAVLTLGDSLRQKIDEGLARCRFGVVILSPDFLNKRWPQKELNGLSARENATGEKAIIPIWHNLDATILNRYSPTLADRVAGRSEEGLPTLVGEILKVLSSRATVSHPVAREQMVFEESVYWKRENGHREGPYCPNCYEDKGKHIHLTPGATKGTYACGVCRNNFRTDEYNPKPIRRRNINL